MTPAELAQSGRARFRDHIFIDEPTDASTAPYAVVGTPTALQCCRWNPSNQRCEWYLVLATGREVPITSDEVDVNSPAVAEAEARAAFEAWETEFFDEAGKPI